MPFCDGLKWRFLARKLSDSVKNPLVILF
jgi:hypothetical protein